MSMQADPTSAFDPEAVIDAMAPLLGLAVADEYRRSVIINLQVTLKHAALVMEFPLTDHDEPAPVFSA